MIEQHESFMREALTEAAKSLDHGDVPIGALVVRGTEVIARAHNEREFRNDPSAHAEVLALQAASRAVGSWRLSDCTLYVTLEPCPMCAGATVLARLARLVYGPQDPRAGAAYSLYNIPQDPRLNHRVEIVPDILSEECAALLRRFFADKR
ncbi:MAG: tRNA adenosine(34) deaminase TadA [Actinomycetota bacterium]